MPNVLLFMVDEHNPRVSSLEGHPHAVTPNLERLAHDGAVFQAAYSASPLCLPSRAAFTAGLPVHRLQTYNNCTIGLPAVEGYPTFLRRAGVHTCLIGKSDLWAPATDLSFAQTMLCLDRAAPGDAAISREPLSRRSVEETLERARGHGPREDALDFDEACVAAAEGWLVDTAPSLGRPWVLAVNVLAPHFPHHAPARLWDRFEDAADLPTHGPDQPTAHHPYAHDLRWHFRTDLITEEDTRGLRRGYVAKVAWADEALGRLRAALAAGGQADDTVVVYTSDHGEMLGKFGMWWKGSLLEDSARVPLVIAGPDVPAGRVSATPVTLQDLHSTLYAATGAPAPPGRGGQPLYDLVDDVPARTAFAEYHGHGTRGSAYLLRRGNWKLLYNTAAPHQLFDLAVDPEELRDQAAARPDMVAALTAELRTVCDPEAEAVRANEFTERQLARIGHLTAGVEPAESYSSARISGGSSGVR